MAEPYTPTTDDLRLAWRMQRQYRGIAIHEPDWEARADAEFDRGLAEYDVEVREAYEKWRDIGQRLHAALLEVWQAVVPDTEYATFGDDAERAVRDIFASLRERDRQEAEKALRDAAESMSDLLECSGDTRWKRRLLDRADRIAAGESGD